MAERDEILEVERLACIITIPRTIRIILCEFSAHGTETFPSENAKALQICYKECMNLNTISGSQSRGLFSPQVGIQCLATRLIASS